MIKAKDSIGEMVLEYKSETNDIRRNVLMKGILDQFDRLTNKMRNKYYFENMEQDDLQQELRICMINAIDKYDGSACFSTYVMKACQNHIYKMHKFSNVKKRINLFGNDISIDGHGRDSHNGEVENSLESIISDGTNDHDDTIFNMFFDSVPLSDIQRKSLLSKMNGFKDEEFGILYPEYAHFKKGTITNHRKNAKKIILTYMNK